MDIALKFGINCCYALHVIYLVIQIKQSKQDISVCWQHVEVKTYILCRSNELMLFTPRSSRKQKKTPD